MRQKINSHLKKNSFSHSRSDTDENQMLKMRFFEILTEHLKQNASLNVLIYYIFQIIEAISLLWFFIHPTLNLFSNDNYLYSHITESLKMINFYEYLRDNPNLDITMTVAVFSYLLFQLLLLFFSIMGINKKNDSQGFKYLKKIVNMQYIFTVKVLSGPFFGLTVNVLYCKVGSVYHIGQTCYQSTHLVICLLMGAVFIILLAEIVIFSTFYLIRNPFSQSCLAQTNRLYFLSKSLLKLAFPIYFAISSQLNLQFLYIIFAPVILVLYIIFHRFMSVPTFKHQHFYFSQFLQGTLLWVGVNGTISYYIQGTPNRQQLSLVYTILSSMLMGYVLVSIQRKFHTKFVEDCLQQKMKKQQIQKFMLSLVNSFFHIGTQQGKMTFKVYEGIILHNKNKLQLNDSTSNDQETNWIIQVYRFLLEIVEEYLQEKKNVGLTLLRIYLLQFLKNKNAALHQSFQLEQQRLNIMDQFAVYYCRHSTNCTHQLLYRNSAEQVKIFQYQQQVNLLDDLIQECTQNSLQYWEELREIDPSIPKLRNLATLYTKYDNQITVQYQKVLNFLPNCFLPTLNYLLYLLEMGVDIKETINIKQKLKSIIDNKTANDKTLGVLKEDVNMIAVDTLENNIGIIINSNSEIKSLLGYQKNSIIGKPLTKLMPQIYAELHNTFLLNYIYKRSNETNQRLQIGEQQSISRQSMDQPQKIVTALNNESLLVVIGLQVQIITTADNKLVIAGFLNKKSQDESGLLMIQGYTGQILAFDSNFMDLMKHKISGKQLLQEQIRFNTLLPEISLDTIEKEVPIITPLQLGHISGDEDKQNLKVNVAVSLKQVKIYQQHKIIFLSIIDSQFKKQHTTAKPSKSRKSKSLKEILPLINQLNSKSKTIQSSQQLSINCSQTDLMKGITKDKELTKELPISRIMQDFITKKQESGLNWLVNGSYIVIILFLSIYLSISQTSHNSYLNFMSNFYIEMELGSDMMYQQAQINYYINNIWSGTNNYYRKNHSSVNIYPLLEQSVNQLSNDLTELIQATQLYNFGLQFNEQTQYSFIFPKAINRTITHYDIELSYTAALHNYINCAHIFLTQGARNTSLPSALMLLGQMSAYIVYNGDEILPSIARGVILQFKDYSYFRTQKQIKQIVFIKAGLLLFCVICLASVVMIGRHINNKQNEVLQLYQKLKIWDINQFRFRCSQYMTIRSKGIRQKTLNLTKSEVVKSLKNIMQQTQKIKQQEDKQLAQRSMVRQKQESYMLVNEQGNPKKQQIQKEQNEALLKKNMCVRLTLEKDNQRICILVTVVLLTVVTLIGASVYLCFSSLKSLLNSFELLQNIGIVRKNIALLNLYAYKVMLGSQQTNYFRLIQKQILQFYKYSDLTYRELGQTIFKEVYSQVDIIQKYFLKPNLVNSNRLSDLYVVINQAMFEACHNISKLDETVFKTHFDQTISQASSTQLTLTIIIGISALISILLIHFCYIECLQTQKNNSFNMLKVLPAWLLHRTPQALSLIT